MDMILGVIFPERLARYQVDWADGFTSRSGCGPAVYAAMRLTADLTGVVTPNSLVGHTADELGLMSFGSALVVLTDFVASYISECPNRQ